MARSLSVALLLAASACSAPREAPVTTVAEIALPEPAAVAPEPVAPPASLLPPEWRAIATRAPSPSTPTAFVADHARPTYIVFWATWCGGCRAGTLYYAHLAERFRGRVRVGLALVEDSDEAYASFSRSIDAAIDAPVWSDDATTQTLKEACGVAAIPAGCLLDAEQRVVWSGEPSNAAAMLDALGDRFGETTAREEQAASLVDAAIAAPDDAAARARALEAAAGLAGLENERAWNLVLADEALELAAWMARDASVSTGGLDFAILDTYAFALWKLGHERAALSVAARGMAVCSILDASCDEERGRFEEFRLQARE